MIINVEPLPAGSGYEFVNQITGGRIPREYIPAVDEGIQDAMQFGVLAGYPVEDVKVTLVDGAYHDVDSSELAFRVAGSMVFKEAARRADPALLEPVMAVEVTTPEAYLGTVIGDLNARRGHVQAMNDLHGNKVVAGARAAVGDVRLRRRPAVQDLGSGLVLDGVPLLRGDPEDHRRGDHPEGTGGMIEASMVTQQSKSTKPSSVTDPV